MQKHSFLMKWKEYATYVNLPTSGSWNGETLQTTTVAWVLHHSKLWRKLRLRMKLEFAKRHVGESMVKWWDHHEKVKASSYSCTEMVWIQRGRCSLVAQLKYRPKSYRELVINWVSIYVISYFMNMFVFLSKKIWLLIIVL